MIPGADDVIAAVTIKPDEADVDRLLALFAELRGLIAGATWRVGDTFRSIGCDEDGRNFEATTAGYDEAPYVGEEPEWLSAKSLASSQPLPATDDDPDTLWAVLAPLGRNDPRRRDVVAALQRLDSLVVALAGLRRYPSYVATEAERELRDLITAIEPSRIEKELLTICELFLHHWNSSPRHLHWYGDLVNNFAPHGLLLRIAGHESIVAQMCRDFAELADAQRAQPDKLLCRRLESAGALLLKSRSRSPLEVLMPIIARDLAATFGSDYESRVHLPMLRVVRQLGARV